jgi:amino acid transporter
MFYNSTQSLAATSFMTTVLIVCEMAGGIASLAAASRQLWAFARNGGLPFSSFFAPSHLKYSIPLNSILFSLTLPLIITLINFASSEGLNIVLSIYNAALVSSYTITISCILLHRLQGRRLPDARYSLGKYGVLCNSISLIYLIPALLFSLFPSTPNPTATSMNWAIGLVGGVILFATIYYVAYGRKQYTTPDGTVDDYIERSAANAASPDLKSATGEEKSVGEEKADKEPVEERD